jgi:hypothetical protein
MVTQIRSGSATLEVVKNKDYTTIRVNKEYIYLNTIELAEFIKGLQTLLEEKK